MNDIPQDISSYISHQHQREPVRGYCADLSTSMTFDTDVDQSILISFLEGAKVGAY